MKRMKMGWAIVLAMLMLPGSLWAQSLPTISITPSAYPHSATIKCESYIPPMIHYLFFYRGTHPYFVTSSSVNIWTDTIRTLDVSDPLNNLFVDSSSGIGDTAYNFCYFMRGVDTVDPADRSTWLFSAPSNVVCEWAFPLVAPPGLTHWNQVTVPLLNNQTDTLAGWGNRIAGISEIDEWNAKTQTMTMKAIKSGGTWTSGGNRRTKYVRPYHITGQTIGGVVSFWGDRLNDTCDTLRSNDTLTDLNNIALQPAFHWFQDDSSSNFQDLGMKLYDGTATNDYGVREVLEWAPSTQSWQSRSLWNGTTWTSRPGVKVYGCYMLRRPYNNIPGGTGTPCWPVLVR